MQQTLLETINLVHAEVAGESRYLAIGVQALFTEGCRNQAPTFTRLVCVFRNVLTVDGQPQPWLWQNRPYFATAAGELLVFRDAYTQCTGCRKTRISYGFRDAINRLFCMDCPVEFPVTSLPIDPLMVRYAGAEVAILGVPTGVWPDQFPVSVFRDILGKELGHRESLIEVNGSDLEELVAPSWFG